jgi:prevent-host-death family protein
MKKLTPTRTVMTSREFNQDTGKAKRAASEGPVIITDRGEPTHALLTFEDFRRLTARPMTGLEALSPSNPDEHDFEFEIPRLHHGGWKIPDFSDG